MLLREQAIQGTSPEVDIALLEQTLLEIPGVIAVHDLRARTITFGIDATSCHLVAADMAQVPATFAGAKEAINAGFGPTHATLQIEVQNLREADGMLRLRRQQHGELESDARASPMLLTPGAATRNAAPRRYFLGYAVGPNRRNKNTYL